VSILRAGFLVLAQQLQEAAESLSSNELRSKLSDAVSAAHSGSDKSGYYQDHTGDEDSGDCIYQCYGGGESNMMKAPYSKGTATSDDDYTLDTSKAVKVVPRTTYEEQPDDADHYAAMEAAKLYTKGTVPLCERFVSKSERAAAGSGDFAGKGKSFPILKKEDVAAAAASIGRAGADNHSTNTIKANIIKIAKAKGWESELPKAWQSGAATATEAKKPMKDCPDCDGSGKDDDEDCDTCSGTGKVPAFTKKSKESRAASAVGMQLVESAATIESIVLREAKADYEIKLIAPGAGSSAYYPADVLKRDGPGVFKSGTHVYLNHATRAEEAERPEGDVRNLAGVLTQAATYHESHAKGPGLYSRMKVFADHGQLVEEKAPHVGMSIRANGDALTEGGRVVTKEGKKVLGRLTSAESVDVVTRAGAGGMILTEAAHGAMEDSMTAEEKALLSRLVEKDVRREAIEVGARTLEGVALNEAAKMYIIETVVDRGVPKSAGALDETKFVEAVTAEARRFGGAIGAGPRVTGMGAAPPVALTEAQRAAIAASEKEETETYQESWKGLIGDNADEKLLSRAMKGRAN
jgi:hypothetical protein